MPDVKEKRPWMVSLHGGHSGTYCDHAVGTLVDVVEAARAAGMTTFGLSEHAPRTRESYLYDEEHRRGWGLADLDRMFDAYCAEARALAEQTEDFELLFGYECEVVPQSEYVHYNAELRQKYGFEFVVGSVHFVHDSSIDGPRPLFEDAMADAGGLEALCVDYYEALARMALELQPEVVGHFDLIRKNGRHYGDVDTENARAAALEALDVVADVGAILDLNCAGFRKGLEHPYPAPWIVESAVERGVPFCFGDDSHGPKDVGLDVDRGRDYLLSLGVETITTLTRTPNGIGHRQVSLLPE